MHLLTSHAAIFNLRFRRHLINGLALGGACLSALAGLTFLVWILGTTLVWGWPALNWALFTHMTPPPAQAGGLLNAFFGSAAMVTLAVVLATPMGIAAGTFMAEYARGRWWGDALRFANDILLSAPSIVVGLFIYALAVRPVGHFSGYAGSLALAAIMLPIVARTTDDMLRTVPDRLREAVLALGLPRWRLVSQVLYRAVRTGVLTGVLLGVARITGETAPLLFTALNNQYWTHDLSGPMANLPVVIFQYAISPYVNWQNLAWAGALVTVLLVLVLNVSARLILRATHSR